MAMRQEGGAPEGLARPPQPPQPLELNNAALQLTMKWIEHASEASELAVSDARLAEAQARAIGQFFNVLRETIKPSFGPGATREEPKQGAPASEAPAAAPSEAAATAVVPPSAAPAP